MITVEGGSVREGYRTTPPKQKKIGCGTFGVISRAIGKLETQENRN
jgi:hypothetical protein